MGGQHMEVCHTCTDLRILVAASTLRRYTMQLIKPNNRISNHNLDILSRTARQPRPRLMEKVAVNPPLHRGMRQQHPRIAKGQGHAVEAGADIGNTTDHMYSKRNPQA